MEIKQKKRTREVQKEVWKEEQTSEKRGTMFKEKKTGWKCESYKWGLRGARVKNARAENNGIFENMLTKRNGGKMNRQKASAIEEFWG